MNKNLKNFGLNFSRSIEKWDEAIPIGNGNLGALIYGRGPIRYSIDALALWDERKSEVTKSESFNYKTLVECVKGGDEGWERKKQLFEINEDYPYPSKISAGRIELDFGETSSEITSSLDILTATANLEYKGFKLESFVAATRPVGIIKIFGNYSLKLNIPRCFSSSGKDSMNYPLSSVLANDGFTYYVQKTHTDYSFAVVLYTKRCEGFDEIYYTVASNEDSEDFLESAKKILKDSAELGYDFILKEHKTWWHAYWNKSDVSIPNKEMEKAYYLNWYLFASTSRKGGYPMTLQGVWTADNDSLPPWSGDYHHDLNTEMSYWGYAKAGRLNEGRVFADYLWNKRKAFESHAKSFYKVKGYLIPGCSSRDGGYMGSWVQYSLSPTLTIWAAKAFDDYYRYTNDLSFLKNRAYPFFKKVEEAIFSLFEERDGKYYLPISSSPEVYESDAKSCRLGNTNFDQSLIIYLYKTLSEYATLLGKSPERYGEILKKLDGIYVSPEGFIMISQSTRLPFSHRHFSHLMSIYPLHLINYDTPENKRTINNSLWELEQQGTGWWVGFSFPWCATLYAIAENGGGAYEKLRAFVKGFLSPNGFHLNGDYKNLGFSQWHYRPFTLEGNVAYNDALQEMLLQDHAGYIDLFPALPQEWRGQTEFKKLNSLGNIRVSAKTKNGTLSASFTAKKPREIKLKNRFSSDKIFVKYKNTSREISIKGLDFISLDLLPGTTFVEEI